MNLYYDPTMMELSNMIEKANPSVTVHNIVIDFDGEVIIDPEMQYPDVPLNRYKLWAQVKTNATKKAIKSLFIKLIDGFNDQPRHLYNGRNLGLAA